MAPTAANANSPDADLTTAGAAAEDDEDTFVDVAVAPEVREADEPVVDAEELVAVFGYKSVLLYVAQELVAGIAVPSPGWAWFSPKQTENSLGA